MCMLCVELQTEKLTIQEAYRNYREIKDSLDEEHQKEILRLLYNKSMIKKPTTNKKNP